MTSPARASSTLRVANAKTLDPQNALEEGSELWVIPDRRNSYWARRIDWHLQFLISRSMIHESPQISGTLEKILKDNDLENDFGGAPKNLPLLIFSVDLLPNREIIHLPYSNNFEAWLESVQAIWKNLKTPSIRVFLPREQDSKDFNSHWTEKKNNVSVVIDIGGH